MKKILFFALCIMLVGVGSLAMAKKCGPKSKPCGKTCIALDKECHVEPAKDIVKKKNCGPKSKPCGNTCIAANKECKVDKK